GLEAGGGPQRPVAADDDQRVDACRLDGFPDRLVAVAVHVRVHAGGAEDGAPLIEDPPDVVAGQRPDEALHQAPPPFLDAYALAATSRHAGDHAPDGGVEARTVASGGEHPHLHLCALLTPRRLPSTPGSP